MDAAEQERREAVFAEAKAGVLGYRPRLARSVQLEARGAAGFAIRNGETGPTEDISYIEWRFLWLVDGRRTVGEIIDLMAEEVEADMAAVIETGKGAMQALHRRYVDGVIAELRTS
jgi:hypothetical protein